MSISVAARKSKARKAQQLVRDKLLAAYPDLEADDIKSIGMGQSGNDIELSPAARKLIPYAFEVKARAKVALIYDALEQAAASDKIGLTPVAVVKGDRKKPVVVVDLDHFISLISRP